MPHSMAVSLAADILEDHFGPVAGRVGTLLMERGALPLQEIMRVLNAPPGGPNSFRTAEPIKFPVVRNALLAMVQHCVVVATPLHKAAAGDPAGSASAPHRYMVETEQVHARLRFPQYLEQVRASRDHGEQGYRLLLCVLKHGRATVGVAIADAAQALNRRGQLTPEELSQLHKDLEVRIRKLYDAGFLRPVVPLTTRSGDSRDTVYCLNRQGLNLLLLKNNLLRMVEERADSEAGKLPAAQVLGAMLESVKLADASSDDGRCVSGEMSFTEIEAMMHQLEYSQAGRNPEREREQLRKTLDDLTKCSQWGLRGLADSDTTGLIRKKMMTGGTGVQKKARLDKPVEQRFAWYVNWASDSTEGTAGSAKKLMRDAVVGQFISNEFGPKGLRVFNLLSDREQKLDEKDIHGICMMPETECREILNAMLARGIVSWQEVPKGALQFKEPKYNESVYLYYIDRVRMQPAMLRNLYQGLLSLRIRFRTEIARNTKLESASESALKVEERQALVRGRMTEDVLERSFLVLDTALLIFRHC